MDTETTAVSGLRSFWGLSLCLGVLAAMLEWLRVDPTFGTSVSIWLFFPLLAVVWRGFWAGILTALAAAALMLVFGRAMFLPFDAAVFVGTTAVVGWCCNKGETSRVIDGVLLSWLITVPASVWFHLELYRRDMNAGILITTTMLLSQLVPAMLVQWLAFTRRPLIALNKFFGPRRPDRPVHLLIVVRAAVIPMILLPLLVTQYFSITQWLSGRTALEERRAMFYGELLLVALEDPLTLVSLTEQDPTGERLLVQVRTILSEVRTESPSSAMAFDVEWVDRATAASATNHFVETDRTHAARSPIDWLMHRQVVFDIDPGVSVLPDQRLRLTVPVMARDADTADFKVWGLASALLFLVLLEALYRLALLRLIGSFNRFGEQIANWVPGQPLKVISDVARGRIAQVDQYAEGVAGLVADFNDNYRALSETNVERRKLLARVSAILTSVSEPIIVTDARLVPLPNFCNELGKLWSLHLASSLQEAAGRLEGSASATSTGPDPFADTFVAAIRGDQGVLDNNLTLADWEGRTHEFGISLGIIGAQPGQRVDVHGNQTVDGFVILLTDLSKLLTQQWERGRRDRLESLENVASGVAHEVNQPLNIIRMASKNLLHKAATGTLEPAVLQSKLERIDEQVGRMADLVTTMRAFSSSETQGTRETDPNALVQNIVALMSGSLRRADINLDLSLCDDSPHVLANSNALGHVFAEIIQNAIDALRELPAGQSKHLAISTRALDGQWQVTFEDNGGGMSQEALGRVFEPFFTTKEQAVHSGFGLHEALGIITSFEGSLRGSNGSRGACFTVTLPLLPGNG